MAVIAFKRIGKEPPAPKVDPKPLGVEWPTRAEVAKMTPEEAYKAGEKLGDAINAAKLDRVAVVDLLSGAAKTNVVSATAGTLSPAQVAAARINLRNATTASLTDTVTTLFKKSDSGIGHKQWSIYVRSGNTVVVEWGHCDKTKQEKVYPFVNRPHLMESWMREAILGKLKKGYAHTREC